MNYWQLLSRAERHLADGRLRRAEEAFQQACGARESDGRRVLVTERLPDGARRLWRRMRGGQDGPVAGRWEARRARFLADFEAAATEVVRQVGTIDAHVATTGPQAAADLLDDALFLAVATCLVERPLAASDLLRDALRLAPATGRLPACDLAPPADDLDGGAWLELAELAVENLSAGAQDQARAWAEVLLDRLDATAPPTAGHAGLARVRWAAARLADQHLDAADPVAARWAACETEGMPEGRRVEARLRRVELLAGMDARRPDVPDPETARRLAGDLTGELDATRSVRLQTARAVLDYRVPRDDLDHGWCTAATDAEGRVWIVLWWRACPRELAVWRPGTDVQRLRRFVAMASGRVVWAGAGPPASLSGAWPGTPPGRGVDPYLEVVLEPMLPPEGMSGSFVRGLALARSGPWRQDWRPDLGLPALAPPGHEALTSEADEPHAPALRVGLLWLAVLHRLETGDPALRAGIGELGRRGHAAAGFLHACAVLGSPEKQSLDAGFAPWTLPLLWTRPDPLARTDDEPAGAADLAGAPELAGQDVAVVTTGRPVAAMRAWGEEGQRWRVVVDRKERVAALGALAPGSVGPVTMVPPAGRVHRLDAALRRLEEFDHAGTGDDQMLAILHWVRLVETHNGDLLDHRTLRPRPSGVCPLHDRYAALVDGLPTEPPAADGDGWGAQYAQRARRSGLLVGDAADLASEADVLDRRWGVYDGSDVGWVFLDAAAVHWRLADGDVDRARAQHALLASRGLHHLSILSGQGLFPRQLASWYDAALAPHGRPYHADLGDARPCGLRVAGVRPLPTSALDPGAAVVAALAQLDQATDDCVVVVPRGSPDRRLWEAAADGAFGPVRWRLAADVTEEAVTRLVLAELCALAEIEVPAPSGDRRDAWLDADRRREGVRRAAAGRAALELAALQSTGSSVIEVLDARWWRWLVPHADGPEAALASLGDVAAQLLPAAPVVDDARAGSIRAWLADEGRVGGLVPGWPGPPLGSIEPRPIGGVHLHAGSAEHPWPRLAVGVLRAWERGDEALGLVVIAERPPAGMASLASALGPLAAASVSGNAPGAAGPPGPLRWARPDDLLEAVDAAADLEGVTAVLLDDLDRLLPCGTRANERGAAILAWLAERPARHVDLVGGSLGEAWLTFLGEHLGPSLAGIATRPGGWPRIRRGMAPRSSRPCPHCGHAAPGEVDGRVCGGCGFDLADPAAVLPTADRIAAATRALLDQADLGRDEPLEVWVDADERSAVRAVLQDSGAHRLDGDVEVWQLAAERRWTLRALAPDARSTTPPAVLLDAPDGPERLRPEAPAAEQAELMLVLDGVDLRRARHDRSPSAVAALLAALARDDVLDHAGGGPPAAAATVSSWTLSWLTGLGEPAIRRALAELRWAARLAAGERGAGAAAELRVARAVRMRCSRRAMEMQLGALSAMIHGEVGALLAASLPGERFLMRPRPASDEDPDIGRLDRMLHLVVQPAWQQAVERRPALIYRAPGGAWGDQRRRVGRLAATDVVLETLAGVLDDLSRWADGWFGEASLVAADLEVPLPDPMGPRERGWLALGEQLGFWTLPADERHGVLSRAEVESRLRPMIAATDTACRRLLQGESERAAAWFADLERTPAGGVVTRGELVAAGSPTRSWWRRGQTDPLAPVRSDVTRVVDTPGSGMLVVAGRITTGAMPAVMTGLGASPRGRRAEIWCPDAVTAAHAHRIARGVDVRWCPDLRVAGAGEGPIAPSPRAPGDDRPLVMLQVQRFARETRYRLQAAGRDTVLVMSVDPDDSPSAEAWEDLFVVTPRRSEVRRLQVPVSPARALWELTREIDRPARGDARPSRRERGQITIKRAVTIDECAAAVAEAVAAGKLDDQVRVIAPHAEDVDLLARALSDRGWAAVTEERLAPLLGPGTLEAMAALADAHRVRHGEWPGGGGLDEAQDLLLPCLFAADEAGPWRVWLRSLPAEELDGTAAFLARWRRTPWSEAVSGSPAARRQITAWSEAAPATGSPLPPALWRAWRREAARMLARADLRPVGPVATLATADAPASGPCDSLAYVCFGSEPAAVHRRCLTQATDRLLVLYQERSPLPGEAGDDGAD
ncbi:hypothetical protein GF314_15290 [bacterium]|nr:hypothetical protein [bacterium]